MSLNQIHNQMSQSWRELRRSFDRSHSEWDDRVHNQFKRDYWQGLDGDLQPYLQSLSDLAQTIQKARQNVK